MPISDNLNNNRVKIQTYYSLVNISMSDPVTYTVPDAKDYFIGFFATGLIAIVQTCVPVVIGQLWNRDERIADSTINPWY